MMRAILENTHKGVGVCVGACSRGTRAGVGRGGRGLKAPGAKRKEGESKAEIMLLLIYLILAAQRSKRNME